MTLVRLKPAAIQSQVKHSTTKPLRSLCVLYVSGEYLVISGDPIWPNSKQMHHMFMYS